MAEKDASAVDLGRKRWRGKTKAERRAHSLMMNEKRWGKKKRQRKAKEERDV